MTSGQSETNREFGEYDTDPDERGEAYPQDGQKKRALAASRDRVKELAKHKEPKIGWHTCVGPRVMWGTQDSLWPVSPRAMAAKPTSRTQTLAEPKKNFQAGTEHEGRPIYYYSVGRPSVIWPVSEGAQNASPTERVQTLAKHKQQHPEYNEGQDQFYYSCGRESPIWQVSSGATKCPDRPHTNVLASPRGYHPEFRDERPIQTQVTKAAQHASLSDRVAGLAEPKDRSEGPFRDPEWPVSEKAKSSVATARCAELAQHKPLAEGFQHARGIEWPVSKGAMHAKVTPRVEELSRPITRDTMNHVQFNPNAFKVRESALRGVIPQRIQELSQPINR